MKKKSKHNMKGMYDDNSILHVKAQKYFWFNNNKNPTTVKISVFCSEVEGRNYEEQDGISSLGRDLQIRLTYKLLSPHKKYSDIFQNNSECFSYNWLKSIALKQTVLGKEGPAQNYRILYGEKLACNGCQRRSVEKDESKKYLGKRDIKR